MPNHVHLIVTPGATEGFGRAIGEAHRRYTRRINMCKGWRGYLWQGRFSSFPLDERYGWEIQSYFFAEQQPFEDVGVGEWPAGLFARRSDRHRWRQNESFCAARAVLCGVSLSWGPPSCPLAAAPAQRFCLAFFRNDWPARAFPSRCSFFHDLKQGLCRHGMRGMPLT